MREEKRIVAKRDFLNKKRGNYQEVWKTVRLHDANGRSYLKLVAELDEFGKRKRIRHAPIAIDDLYKLQKQGEKMNPRAGQ